MCVDVRRVDHEVVTIHVVDESIAVVVHTGFTVELSLVDPEVVLQVGVVDLEATIDDGHNDILRSRHTTLPGREHVDVVPCHGSFDGPVVVVVPLLRQQGVVERHGRERLLHPCHIGWRHGAEALASVRLVDGYALRILHTSCRLVKIACLSGCHTVFHEGDVVPAVEASSLVLGLILTCVREHTLHAHSPHFLRNAIERCRTGRYVLSLCLLLHTSIRQGYLLEQRRHLRLEFHANLTLYVMGFRCS